MAKLNILCTKIIFLNELIDDNVFFSYKSVEDFYLKLNPVIIPMDEEPDNISGLTFEEYASKSSDRDKLCILNCALDFSLSDLKKNVYIKIIMEMDGYELSLFLNCLRLSPNYVQCVNNHFAQVLSNVKRIKIENLLLMRSTFQIILIEPKGHVMDLIWAKMACQTINEMHKMQYAMSWLSTLGGTYSTLGEGKKECARIAGLISLEQLRIALKLGNEIIITQCKLYFSLSLIQQGRCRIAKGIILQEYTRLKNSTVVDRRTVNMCKGIWARLKYELHRRREAKRKAKCNLAINDNKQPNTLGLALFG